VEGKIPLDVFIIEEDKSNIEILKLQLGQKSEDYQIKRISSLQDHISPNMIKENKFNLILCNKKYFDIISKEQHIPNLAAWGLVDIPFYVYMVKPYNKDGSNPEKVEVLTKLDYCQFKKYGTIVGRVDKEIWRCLDEVLIYNKKIEEEKLKTSNQIQ